MQETDDILKGKYPAKAHAKKVVHYLLSKGAASDGIIYLEGQKTRMIEDNDGEAPFRQRRYFFYLSGCQLPDCALTYSISTSTLTLFIPPLDPDSVIWSGLPPSLEDALAAYDVDAVHHTTALPEHFSSPAVPQSAIVYAIPDQVTPATPFPPHTTLNLSLIKGAIEHCRVVKDAYEVALIRRANFVSATAHAAAVRAAARGANSERELQAAFLERCVALGSPEQAYAGIFAGGTNAATLHYVRNDAPLAGALNVLLDAAAEERCYAADITRTFPISGTFSEESRAVYEIVLEMQMECIAALRGGVVWDEVHVLAHRILIRGLLGLGLLKGGTEEEILEARTSVAFLPHGLGHYLGMDTHDTGGNANYQDKDPMFRYLRVRGKVPAGAVITVEPGCYFCRFIIEPYLKDEKQSKYINKEVLDRYWPVGGVRIEDDILVTESGTENLTSVPKTIEEMSRIYKEAA